MLRAFAVLLPPRTAAHRSAYNRPDDPDILCSSCVDETDKSEQICTSTTLRILFIQPISQSRQRNKTTQQQRRWQQEEAFWRRNLAQALSLLSAGTEQMYAHTEISIARHPGSASRTSSQEPRAKPASGRGQSVGLLLGFRSSVHLCKESTERDEALPEVGGLHHPVGDPAGKQANNLCPM